MWIYPVKRKQLFRPSWDLVSKSQPGTRDVTAVTNVRMVVSPLCSRTGQHPWLCPGWKILPTRIGYCSNTNDDRRFRCEDNNVAFTNVQPHFYRVRQVEPCYQLGWSSPALIFSISAVGVMPQQQQPQKHNYLNRSAPNAHFHGKSNSGITRTQWIMLSELC